MNKSDSLYCGSIDEQTQNIWSNSTEDAEKEAAECCFLMRLS